MILPIITHPNDRYLRTQCDPVTQHELANTEFQTLIDNMIPTMYHAEGIGLAAPQIGTLKQMTVIGKEAYPRTFYINDKPHDLSQDLVLVNPTWERMGRNTTWDTEGCLSIPHTYGKVKRYKRIYVTALDRYGEKISFEAKGFLSRVIQHEVDHLNGILFIDKAREIYNTD